MRLPLWARRSLRRIDRFFYLLRPSRFRRAWRLVRVYWGTEDFDWSSVGILMEHQLKRMRHVIGKYGMTVGSDRHARQMGIAVVLLDRILEDKHYDIADARYPNRGKHWARMADSIYKQDWDMLMRILSKHMHHWWD